MYLFSDQQNAEANIAGSSIMVAISNRQTCKSLAQDGELAQRIPQLDTAKPSKSNHYEDWRPGVMIRAHAISAQQQEQQHVVHVQRSE